MKPSICLAAGLLALTLTPVIGQPSIPPAGTVRSIDSVTGLSLNPGKPEITRFNLDFPGGTPGELVAAIQKAMGKPLNAIIPAEHANVQLPPLKMNNVDVPRLFLALEQASVKSVAYVTSTYYGGGFPGGPSQSYQTAATDCGFRTVGTPTDDSIWYFHVDKPGGPPLVPSKACRFYSLAPYLERGLTVDDVTTAIETGWKMEGNPPLPQINFHKETKLLIAVGEPSKLETIDAVLKALEPPKSKPIIDPSAGLPPPKTEPKAKQ
jgi:hypothetical protein